MMLLLGFYFRYGGICSIYYINIYANDEFARQYS